MPADLAGTTRGPRQERFVRAVANAMQRPLRDHGVRRPSFRKAAAVATAATFLLLAVGVVFAAVGDGSIAGRLSGMFRTGAAPMVASSRDVGASSPTVPRRVQDAHSRAAVEERIEERTPNAQNPPSDGVGRGPRRGAAPTATELANQNRLFASAMNARERGDSLAAVRLLDDFVRRYPASPLAPDAYVERFRTLAQIGDRQGAARAARSYLSMYASGFARDEARALALAPDR
jgi:hypothetical protein